MAIADANKNSWAECRHYDGHRTADAMKPLLYLLLFGFDRTREIGGMSAQEIAEAAKGWGQNDDITVVTVRRAL